jgi:hypothetical protein
MLINHLVVLAEYFNIRRLKSVSEDVPTSLSYYFYDTEYNSSALSGEAKFTEQYAQHTQREGISL